MFLNFCVNKPIGIKTFPNSVDDTQMLYTLSMKQRILYTLYDKITRPFFNYFIEFNSMWCEKVLIYLKSIGRLIRAQV